MAPLRQSCSRRHTPPLWSGSGSTASGPTPPPSPVRADCIGLLTDYGYEGGFVGVLHAVAQSIAPGISVLDLDHSIPPADVRLGALRLERLVKYVPQAVLVGVVDPGVGGARRPVAIGTGRHLFVGP